MFQQCVADGLTSVNRNNRDPRFVEGVIANLPLFREVCRANLALVASQARVQYSRRGAVIARQGEPLPGVIGLAYGLAKLALRRAKGEEKVVRFLTASESFGEAVVFLQRPCPVDIVALADAMLVVIPVRPLQQLLERDNTFANNLLKTLAETVLRLVAELDANAGRSSVQRLAAYLDSLAVPETGSDACAVQLPVTKTALAARLSITKETMSRVLRELKDQGLIEMAGSRITILDRARLTGIAS